jgi:hypothetical protein
MCIAVTAYKANDGSLHETPERAAKRNADLVTRRRRDELMSIFRKHYIRGQPANIEQFINEVRNLG